MTDPDFTALARELWGYTTGADGMDETFSPTPESIAVALEAAARAENEACERLATETAREFPSRENGSRHACHSIAAAIRARRK